MTSKTAKRQCNAIGLCRILSTGKTFFCPFIEEPTAWLQGRKFGDRPISHRKFFFDYGSCVAIAVENLRRRRRRKNCDASTYQSNNFGVSRKRFKPSTPGSTQGSRLGPVSFIVMIDDLRADCEVHKIRRQHHLNSFTAEVDKSRLQGLGAAGDKSRQLGVRC